MAFDHKEDGTKYLDSVWSSMQAPALIRYTQDGTLCKSKVIIVTCGLMPG